MAISQAKSKRKSTGGRYKSYRKKKQYELGHLPTSTKIAPKKLRKLRILGNNLRLRLLAQDVVNVYNPKEKKYVKSKILSIVESSANRHFIRRGILTKGSIIKTEAGNAKVTSRPGQEGTINAVLV